MRVVMSAPKRADFPPTVNQPMPTVWCDRVRGGRESALDSESAISLACHLNDAFANATSWSGLLHTLANRGFFLRFEGVRLALVNEQTGLSLCTCASLGHSFSSLAHRLGKPNVMADTGRLIPKTTLG